MLRIVCYTHFNNFWLSLLVFIFVFSFFLLLRLGSTFHLLFYVGFNLCDWIWFLAYFLLLFLQLSNWYRPTRHFARPLNNVTMWGSKDLQVESLSCWYLIVNWSIVVWSLSIYSPTYIYIYIYIYSTHTYIYVDGGNIYIYVDGGIYIYVSSWTFFLKRL